MVQKKYQMEYAFMGEPLLFGDILLFQLGRLYCMPLAEIGEHVQRNLYELTVVTEGEGVIATNGQDLPVAKGDIYLSFPADFHNIRSSAKAPLKYDFFAFHTTDGEIDRAFKQITAERRLYSQRVIRSEKLAAAVSSAIGEFCEKERYREDMLALLFRQIVLYVLRFFQCREIPAEKKNVNSMEEICFQIMHYIDTHLYSIKHLSVLSDELGYNYSYLSNIFKITTGGTILQYYQTSRLKAAEILIKEGKLTYSKIAEILNYASLYAFSKAFKRAYGVSPRGYEDSLKEKTG